MGVNAWLVTSCCFIVMYSLLHCGLLLQSTESIVAIVTICYIVSYPNAPFDTLWHLIVPLSVLNKVLSVIAWDVSRKSEWGIHLTKQVISSWRKSSQDTASGANMKKHFIDWHKWVDNGEARIPSRPLIIFRGQASHVTHFPLIRLGEPNRMHSPLYVLCTLSTNQPSTVH